jgi:hypothetical protein
MARERGASECRIVVKGELGGWFATQFEGMTLQRGVGTTTLEGRVADQAEVYGLLERVQDLGLELVSVDTADIGDATTGVDDPLTRPDPGSGETGPPRVGPERRM